MLASLQNLSKGIKLIQNCEVGYDNGRECITLRYFSSSTKYSSAEFSGSILDTTIIVIDRDFTSTILTTGSFVKLSTN